MRSSIKQHLRRQLLPDLLHEGETAPHWSLEGHDRQRYTSTNSWEILIFYPKDETATCTSQLKSFNRLLPQFHEQNCSVFGLNPASPDSHARFAKQLGLQFPLLVDHKAQTAELFRCTLNVPLLGTRLIRTVYLINPSRTIRLANRGNPNPEILLRSIMALKQASSKMM